MSVSRATVQVSAPIPDAGIERLCAAGLDVRVGGLDVNGADALLSLLTDAVDAPLLERGDRLRVVANMAVGVDNIDLQTAARLGITVTNTPDVLTDSTADLAFALMLAAGRRVVWGDRLVRSGGFQGWRPLLGLGLDLTGSTLGIVGVGRIGRAVAERARAFRMEVLSCRRTGGVSLDLLLDRSDFVSLHCPLTLETRHLIGERELRLMRPHAVLINTARGPIIDEQALVRALREGWIGAAGLDVYEEEPRLAAGLADLSNVVLLPHVGSATFATRSRMAEIAAENIVAALRGERAPNAVVEGSRT